MSTAPDGSPVELYARLPELGEGDVVASVLPEGASVLELGCGTERITRQLVRLGYRVTAVDESAEMLAHMRGAEAVQAQIVGLELGCRFDGVLVASNARARGARAPNERVPWRRRAACGWPGR